ncbi:MAG: Uncharacterised protein [Synechococcus sp. MIT S9220]|nr:MAG: Uncharacterised protein [Synechococcus sp. MIT S9220]
MQPLHTFNGDGWTAGSADASSHGIQQVGEVLNLRLLRCVLNHAGAFCQACSHQDRFRGADARAVENNRGPFQTFAVARNRGRNHAMFNSHHGAKCFQSADVLHHRACTNATATR